MVKYNLEMMNGGAPARPSRRLRNANAIEKLAAGNYEQKKLRKGRHYE